MEDALDTFVAVVVELSDLPGEARSIPVDVDGEARGSIYASLLRKISQEVGDIRKLDDAASELNCTRASVGCESVGTWLYSMEMVMGGSREVLRCGGALDWNL